MSELSNAQKVEKALITIAEKKLPLDVELEECEQNDGILVDSVVALIRDNWPVMFEEWVKDYDFSRINDLTLEQVKDLECGDLQEALDIGPKAAKVAIDKYMKDAFQILKAELGEPQGRSL